MAGSRQLAMRISTIIASILLAHFTEAGDLYAVRVAWDRNPETDVVSYRVRWGLVGSTNILSTLVSTNSTGLSLSGPGPWSVNVSAVNSVGIEGPASTNIVFAFPSAPASLRVVAGFVTQSTNWVLTP